MILETMAQYGALSTIKQISSPAQVDGYMWKMADRYLQGRGVETEHEMPLAYTELETFYVHYSKGMVVMNAQILCSGRWQ